MTYNPNIPQTNDDPSASQADLLGNFGKLNTDWSMNHIPLTSGANNGFHKFIQFSNVLSGDPTLTGLQSEIYTKLGPDSNPALFFANAAKVYQLTQLPVTTVGTNFGITTPFGFIIDAGSVASGVTTVTLATPLPNNLYTILLTPTTALPTFSVGTINKVGATVVGFTINTSLASGFNYFVLGA